MADFLGFINNLFKGTENKSGNIAKDRLKLVLIDDRNNCTPELLEQISDKVKEAVLQILDEYMEIDDHDLDIGIRRFTNENENKPALIVNIPFKSMKKRR